MARRLYAVAWSWRKHRIVPTKKRGTEVVRVWRKWYERQGWTVRPSGSGGYRAYSPDYVLGQSVFAYPQVHSVSLHEYDPETRERVDGPFPVSVFPGGKYPYIEGQLSLVEDVG